jgi:pimeloyl-ACP methyl ester carboxylesterase
MGSYVQLGEVRTYYEEDGDGPPLVLLHPGGADSRAFEIIVPGLAGHFRVFRPDRRGHGRTPDVDGPITYELMAQDTIAFLEQVVGGPACLVGHSDGAPVALLTALARPDLVPRLVEVSPDGPDSFPALAAKLHRMHSEEPTLSFADLAGYPSPALVMVGDDDDEVPMEHTLALRQGLPRSQLAVVPGAGHGLPADKPELFNRLVVDFLTGDSDGGDR